MGAYEEYIEAVEDHLRRVNELNSAIPLNRAQHAQALRAYDDAVLADDPEAAQAAKQLAAQLDDAAAWLQRDINTMSGRGAKNNPAIKKAAQKVVAANSKAMQEHYKRWEHVATWLAEHKMAFMELVAELGKIQKAAEKLRTQNGDVLTRAGVHSGWAAAPGDNPKQINMLKGTGIIFMDTMAISEIYRRGSVER